MLVAGEAAQVVEVHRGNRTAALEVEGVQDHVDRLLFGNGVQARALQIYGRKAPRAGAALICQSEMVASSTTLVRYALFIGLLLLSCGGNGARVSLVETRVKMGQALDLRVEHVPEGWSGEVDVNNSRRFPIDARRHSVDVTAWNGFRATNDLFVLLRDRNGREIPLPNYGRLHVEALPSIDPAPPKILLDKTAVKLGEDIQIRTGLLPEGWLGEITVNSLRRFPFTAKLYTLKASVENGFSGVSAADLRISLTDSQGHTIALPNGGHFQVAVLPSAIGLDRASRSFDADGGVGEIAVAASAGRRWSVAGLPAWIRIQSGDQGSGSGTVRYAVAENATNDSRSATLSIGGAAFEVRQLRPSAWLPPLRDNFLSGRVPAPVWLSGRARGWVLDEQAGLNSVLSIQPGAPQGGNSLVIEKRADPRAWPVQVMLAGIKTQPGSTYKVSVWMKAENPGPAVIAYGQSRPPYGTCGLEQRFAVSRDWTEFTARFKPYVEGCDTFQNRLSIEAGEIGGKLWIANFSMVRVR
jgi:hypothetical protein